MKNNKTIISALILMVVVAIAYCLLVEDTTDALSMKEPIKNIVITADNTNNKSNIALNIQSTDQLEYVDCIDNVDKMQTAMRTLWRTEYLNWREYLAKGYSLDEVAQAILYFVDEKSAADFKIKQTLQRSEYTKISHRLYQEAKNRWENHSKKPYDFIVKKMVPSSVYAGLFDKSLPQQLDILDSQKLSIDDLAYFISDESIEPPQLLRLIDHTVNVRGIVGYKGLNTPWLINYAIYSNRDKIVRSLLNRGIQPSNEKFLGSSMDWALLNLNRQQSSRGTELQKAVDIVKLLASFHLYTHFSSQSDDEVSGAFQGYQYRFKQKTLEMLNTEYQLGLSELQHTLTDIQIPLNGLITLIKRN